MEKEDFRTVSEDVRYALRRRAIRMIAGGKKKKDVAKAFGVKAGTISDWVKLHRQGGDAALRCKKKGAKNGMLKLLSTDQELQVQRMITDKMPDQLKLNFGLWTRKAVSELIFREFGIQVAISTMGKYLRAWGYTPQKPLKRAYEQNPVAVKKWLDEEYPTISKKAKETGAEIHWGDETGVRNECNHGRSYAPKGHTPVKESMCKRFTVNMISTVTNQGATQFMIYEGTMNSERFIEFLEQFIKSTTRKPFLILDNLKVHHSKAVKAWIESHAIEIEVFYLPSYSPQYNPDEYLNCDLKQGLSDKPSPRNVDQLRKNIEKHTDMLTNNPERVKKYFKHKSIAYAA